ncbi:hypothetical protein DL95DRAFT_418272 [Leptodontidium sp. 2 PMI_412]|nr:hypothetical protein DL95DRAFT_418272 [Leptodontidium sp. 2 PMI_412]
MAELEESNPSMGDHSTAALSEMFRKRLEVLNANLENLEQLRTTRKALPLPPVPRAGLLRLPFEIRLKIYYYCIPRRYVIEVSDPRFYTRWPFEEVDHTLDLEDASDFEDDTVDLEDETLDLEQPQEFEDDPVDLEDNAVYSGSYTLDSEDDY